MRIAAGLLCAAFVGLAAWATCLWATSRWPVRAMLVGMTPVMLFSLSVMAPNGLEMAAALSLWMSLIGLAHRSAVSVTHGRCWRAAQSAR